MLQSVPDERRILVLGAPRSGTTWLAKIFDSAPPVLYRHEPDELCDNAPFEFTDPLDARRVIDALLDRADLRTTKRPEFPKSYRSPARQRLRNAMILALRATGRALSRTTIRSPRVPDMIDPRAIERLWIVVKSIRPQGFARTFALAYPGCRIIMIVRHPCGQVASMMRGASMRLFHSAEPIDRNLTTHWARHYGDTRPLAQMGRAERYAWNWVAFNEQMRSELAGFARLRIVRFADLCADPATVARAMFEAAGLAWNGQTAAFIERSSTGDGADYYGVVRRSAEQPDQWRQLLDDADQRLVLDIASRSSLSELWADTAPVIEPMPSH